MSQVLCKYTAMIAISALTVSLLGCNSKVLPKKYGSPNEDFLLAPHTPLDEHTMADVVEESGLGDLIRKEGLRRDSMYIVGTVAVGRSGTTYGLKPEPFNLQSHDTFRIALSIVTESGERIPDFFEGLPGASEENSIVGKGHHIREIYDWCGSAVPEHVRFHEDFPCEADSEYRHISRTFREFSRHSYFLKDVPVGTAYVWFQLHHNGNLNTQVPIMVDLNPAKGEIQRYDFTVYLGDLFYVL